jgi:hypothetical protein
MNDWGLPRVMANQPTLMDFSLFFIIICDVEARGAFVLEGQVMSSHRSSDHHRLSSCNI